MDTELGKAERSGIERREGFCAMHTEQSSLIAGHSGQWKMLMWGSGIFAVIAIGIIGSLHSLVTNMDKTFAGYIQMHTSESKDGFRRISNLERSYSTLDGRVAVLERNK